MEIWKLVGCKSKARYAFVISMALCMVAGGVACRAYTYIGEGNFVMYLLGILLLVLSVAVILMQQRETYSEFEREGWKR